MSLYLIDLRPGASDTLPLEKIEQIKQEIKNFDNKFIFFALDEDWQHEHINQELKRFEVGFYQKNCVILVDVLLAHHHKVNFYNVIRYNSQLIKVAIDEEYNQYNKEINLDTNKFLFLMGKPYKIHRIGTLYKLYENNLLDKCEYSFIFGDQIYQRTREILNCLEDDEFLNFINKTQRKLDDVKFTMGEDSLHYVGVPVDPNLYKNTSFSLISESMSVPRPHWFLSEKFWRTIASHHMFVIMVNEQSIDHIHNLGFNTFQQFLQVDKSNFNENNEWVIVDNSIKNVKYLLKTIQDNKESIHFQIKKNYKVYRKLIQDSRNIVDRRLEKYLYVNDIDVMPNNEPGYVVIRRLDMDGNLLDIVNKLFKGIVY